MCYDLTFSSHGNDPISRAAYAPPLSSPFAALALLLSSDLLHANREPPTDSSKSLCAAGGLSARPKAFMSHPSVSAPSLGPAAADRSG